jgi:hypothetical protein
MSLIELKFYTHLNKCVFDVFKNCELNQICKSIADLKIRTDVFFVGVFSNELKLGSTWITTNKCTKGAYAAIQRVYLNTQQSPMNPKLKNSIHKSTRRGK